jgi:hypothetical protein
MSLFPETLHFEGQIMIVHIQTLQYEGYASFIGAFGVILTGSA